MTISEFTDYLHKCIITLVLTKGGTVTLAVPL
jgi:hypothetical protein